MDFILGALGIALIWFLSGVLTYIVITVIVCATKPNESTEIMEKNKNTYLMISAAVGLVVVLAMFAKRGGFL